MGTKRDLVDSLTEAGITSASAVEIVTNLPGGFDAVQALVSKAGISGQALSALLRANGLRAGNLVTIAASAYCDAAAGFTGLQNSYIDHVTVCVPGKPIRVRALLGNPQATTVDVPASAVASFASEAPGAAIWAAAGVTWAAVTYSGSASVTLPAKSAAALVSMGLSWSDWTAVLALDRNDGGSGSVFGLRTQRTANGGISWKPLIKPASGNVALYEAAAPKWHGRWYSDSNATGITTPANFTSSSPSQFSPTLALQFEYAAPVAVCVAAYGDSTTQGDPSGSPAAAHSWLLTACAQAEAATGVPFVPANFGFSGQSAIDYLAQALLLIPQVKSQVCVIQVWSQNDGITTAAQDLVRRSLVSQCISAAVQVGTIPVLIVPMPSGSMSAAQNAIRRAVCTWVRSIGCAVMDMDAALTLVDGVAAGQDTYKAGMSTDGVHPNDSVGKPAAAAVALPVLTGAVAV